MARNGLVLLGLGAGLMYLLDPQSGRKRRADLRNQLDSTLATVNLGREVVVRDATNRAHGLIAETRRHVDASKQRRLSGNGGQGGVGLRRASATWSPTTRALAGAFGAGLATLGYFRGGLKGIVFCAIGSGLLARAGTNEDLGTIVKGAIGVEKTIEIDASVEEAFAYWRNLENFPMWMSHVREVRDVGGNRYHWVVDGPAGLPVEWDSELLNVAENHEMTWRSVEGSQVDHTGRVRFERYGDGSRIHVLLKYAPPGGLIGHAVARAFGVDPKSEMDDDLARMKSLIETGNPARDAAALRGAEGSPPSHSHH